MKKTIINISTATILLLFLFFGCTKSEKEPDEPLPTTTGNTIDDDFKWTWNGVTVTADSSFYIPGFNNIVAYKGQAYVDIVLSNLSVGTYSISNSTGNSLEFNTGMQVLTANTGIVKITSNTGSRLSGTFNATLTGNEPMSGQFKDIPKK